MTKKTVTQRRKRAKKASVQTTPAPENKPNAPVVSEPPAAPPFTLASFHRAFGDNFGTVLDGQEPDPLAVAMNVIDDLKRTIQLCEEALFAMGRNEDYETSTIVNVLTNAHFRADAACKVLTPFFLRNQRAI